jgi:predicted GH43/DUF377 family glycosyl hydrolase
MRGHARVFVSILVVCFIVSTILLLTTIQIQAANVWYVAASGSDSNACQLPTDPCGSVDGAISKSSAGDTILITEDIYTNSNPLINDVVTINQDVILSGGWNADFSQQSGYSTIDGENLYRCVFIPSGVITSIDRFIIQNGNWAPAASSGVSSQGNVVIQNSIIRNNTGMTAGGIDISGGELIVYSSSVVENAGNGISQSGGNLIINNSTISSNGSMGIDAANLTLNSSTISNHPGVGVSTSNLATFQNSIIAGNSAGSGPDCSSSGGPISSLGNNLIGNPDGCEFLPIDGDLTHYDPFLGPLAGTPPVHRLLGGSPAINSAAHNCQDHNNIPIENDQRGFPRLGDCDIGSVESQSFKVANDTYSEPGYAMPYRIEIRSTNQTSQLYKVSDTLPPGLTYKEGTLSANTGTYNHENGVINWQGTLAPAQEVQIFYWVDIGQVTGDITNTAVISSGGENWTREATIAVDSPLCQVNKHPVNPVLGPGGSGAWDQLGVYEPAVRKVGQTYMMWYTGENTSNLTQIGVARSTDGITWVKEPSNPVITAGLGYGTSGIEVGDVLYLNGVYKMWYTAIDSSSMSRILFTSSNDGVNWVLPGQIALETGSPGMWDDEFVYSPTVYKDRNTYHMWYTGFDGLTSKIGYATSEDGIDWNKHYTNPVIEPGDIGEWDWLDAYGPSVIKIGNRYKIFYSGETLPRAWQTGFAAGYNEHLDKQRLIIPEGQPGDFDEYSADFVSGMTDENVYKFWYSGLDDQNYSIGYAESSACENISPPDGEANPNFLPYLAFGGGSCPISYNDNFSDPSSGWPIRDNSYRKYAYTNGEYQILVKTPESGWLVTPGAKARNFSLEVSARRTSGLEGEYGIVFGINDDWSHFYEVIIDDAFFSIWKYQGDFSPLVNWTYSPAIVRGIAWNRIKIERYDHTISLYINDSNVANVNDYSPEWGRIGLLAGSPPNATNDARFDDFYLTPYPCQRLVAAEMQQDGIAEVQKSPLWPKRSP